MTDNEYRRTLLLGAIIGASITILALHMTKPEPPVSPQPVAELQKHGTFTVVSDIQRL
jgi:hypothetical protein